MQYNSITTLRIDKEISKAAYRVAQPLDILSEWTCVINLVNVMREIEIMLATGFYQLLQNTRMSNGNIACVNVNTVGRMHSVIPCLSDNDLNSFHLVFRIIKNRILYIIGN